MSIDNALASVAGDLDLGGGHAVAELAATTRQASGEPYQLVAGIGG